MQYFSSKEVDDCYGQSKRNLICFYIILMFCYEYIVPGTKLIDKNLYYHHQRGRVKTYWTRFPTKIILYWIATSLLTIRLFNINTNSTNIIAAIFTLTIVADIAATFLNCFRIFIFYVHTYSDWTWCCHTSD